MLANHAIAVLFGLIIRNLGVGCSYSQRADQSPGLKFEDLSARCCNNRKPSISQSMCLERESLVVITDLVLVLFGF